MNIVVDANVVLAALLRPGGWTATRLKASGDRFFAPATLFDELAAHEAEFAAKAGLSPAIWNRNVHRLKTRIEIVPLERLRRTRRHPLVQRVQQADPDDAWYAACFAATGADYIWTRDHAVLAALPDVAVFTPPPVRWRSPRFSVARTIFNPTPVARPATHDQDRCPCENGS